MACPVIKGEKWLANAWISGRPIWEAEPDVAAPLEGEDERRTRKEKAHGENPDQRKDEL